MREGRRAPETGAPAMGRRLGTEQGPECDSGARGLAEGGSGRRGWAGGAERPCCLRGRGRGRRGPCLTSMFSERGQTPSTQEAGTCAPGTSLCGVLFFPFLIRSREPQTWTSPCHMLGVKGGETPPLKRPLRTGFQGRQWNVLEKTDLLTRPVASGSPHARHTVALRGHLHHGLRQAHTQVSPSWELTPLQDTALRLSSLTTSSTPAPVP